MTSLTTSTLLNWMLLLASLSMVFAATTDDDFTYVNANDTYVAGTYVKYGHKLTNTDFEPTTEYITRVLYSPIVIFGLGLLAMVAFLFALLIRCCSESCRCLPDEASDTYKRNFIGNTVLFCLLCLLVVIIDQLVFLGNQDIDKGIGTFHDVIDGAQDIVTDVSALAGTLTRYGGSLTNQYNGLSTSCPAGSSYFSNFRSYLKTYNDSIKTFSGLVEPLNDNFDTVNSYLDQYAGSYRMIAMYVVWGLALGSVIIFIIARIAKSVGFMKFSMFFALIVYLLYLLLGIPWVLTTSLGADFCMAPSYNVVKSLPEGSLRNMTVYFSSCVGTSPLDPSIDQGINTLHSMNSTLQTLKSSHICLSNTDINSMQTTAASIVSQLEILRDTTLACPRFQDLWFSVLNTALCEQLYVGIFYIWGSQLVTSFLLFWLVVTASFTHHYFNANSVKVAPGSSEGGSGGDDNYELEDGDAPHARVQVIEPAEAQVIEVDHHMEVGKHL